jgi:hypothetical protein
VRLLVGGRHSLEGERAVVKQSCCNALSQDPEPANPRVGAGKVWVPFPDSDEVRSGASGKVSPATLSLGLGFRLVS